MQHYIDKVDSIFGLLVMNAFDTVPIRYILPLTTRLTIPRKFLIFRPAGARLDASPTPRPLMIGTGLNNKCKAAVLARTKLFFPVCPGCIRAMSAA